MSRQFYVGCTNCKESNEFGLNWGGDQIKLVAAHWKSMRVALAVADEAWAACAGGFNTDILPFIKRHEDHALTLLDEYGDEFPLVLDECDGCTVCRTPRLRECSRCGVLGMCYEADNISDWHCVDQETCLYRYDIYRRSLFAYVWKQDA